MNNAKEKEVFQAYKSTKPRSVEKLLFISQNNEIKVHFEEKYDALIEAIFLSSFDNDQKTSQKDFLDQKLLFEAIDNFQNRKHRRK